MDWIVLDYIDIDIEKQNAVFSHLRYFYLICLSSFDFWYWLGIYDLEYFVYTLLTTAFIGSVKEKLLLLCFPFLLQASEWGMCSFDFSRYIRRELINGPRITGVYVALQLQQHPGKVVRVSQIWRSVWPVKVTAFCHQKSRELLAETE